MTHRVGQDVDSWCGKCGFMLAHTVEAEVDGVAKRVHCNTCMGQHNYKPYKPGEAPTKSATKKTAAKKKSPARRTAALKPSDYEKMMEGRDRGDSRRYSPRSLFHKNELVEHPKFGTGLVLATKDGNKFEAIFPEGAKVLIHGR
jgi:hypothetical protein